MKQARLRRRDCRLDKSVALKPSEADPYYQRGMAKVSRGDHPGAIVDYDRPISLQPDNAVTFLLESYPALIYFFGRSMHKSCGVYGGLSLWALSGAESTFDDKAVTRWP